MSIPRIRKRYLNAPRTGHDKFPIFGLNEPRHNFSTWETNHFIALLFLLLFQSSSFSTRIFGSKRSVLIHFAYFRNEDWKRRLNKREKERKSGAIILDGYITNNQSGFYLKKKSPVPYRDINKTFFFSRTRWKTRLPSTLERISILRIEDEPSVPTRGEEGGGNPFKGK